MLNGLLWTSRNTKRRGDERQRQAHLTILNENSGLKNTPKPLKIRLRHFFLTRGYASPLRYLFLALLLYKPTSLTLNSVPVVPRLFPKLKTPAPVILTMSNRSSPMRATLRLFYLYATPPTLPYTAKTKLARRLVLMPATTMLKAPFTSR